MRKILFTLGFLMFFGIAAMAQKPTFGVKFGLNSSNVSFTPPEGTFGTNPIIDLYAGVFTEIHRSEVFSIQPEIFITRVGARTPGLNNRVKYHLTYAEIPLLFNFISEPFIFYAGPQLNILLDARGETKVNGKRYSQNIKENFKGFDASAVIGTAYQFENGFGIDLRFQMGFLNTANNKINNGFPGTGPDTRAEVNATQLGVFYKWVKKVPRVKYSNL